MLEARASCNVMPYYSFSPSSFSADYKIYDRICHVQNIINIGSDGGNCRRRRRRWSFQSASSALLVFLLKATTTQHVANVIAVLILSSSSNPISQGSVDCRRKNK
jgi:hypothetical protein